MHALHVADGALLVGALAVGIGGGGLWAGAVALYRHFIGAVWLTLVALLYLRSALAAGAVLAATLAAAPLARVATLLLVLAPDLVAMR
jgi:hypothetical protein